MPCSTSPSRAARLLFALMSLLGLTPLVVGLSLGPMAACAIAEEPKDKDQPAAKDDAADATEKKDDQPVELPKPVDKELTADDGMILKITYYPGAKDQESVPVLVFHGFSKPCSRKDFDQEQGLAAFLQAKLGCAVIVPDLRGHGDSTKIMPENSNRAEKAKGRDLMPAMMVPQDLRALKAFLWEQNNKMP